MVFLWISVPPNATKPWFRERSFRRSVLLGSVAVPGQGIDLQELGSVGKLPGEHGHPRWFARPGNAAGGWGWGLTSENHRKTIGK